MFLFNTGDCLIEVTAWAGLTVHCSHLWHIFPNGYLSYYGKRVFRLEQQYLLYSAKTYNIRFFPLVSEIQCLLVLSDVSNRERAKMSTPSIILMFSWLSWSHHFKSFTASTMTWLTSMDYFCYKGPRICSTCRKHLPVLSSFMTNHRICN
jgi:hypothetical protein